MGLIWEGFIQAIRLLFSGDPEVLEITLLSLRVSGLATLISLVLGMPFGTWLALGRFRGRSFLLSLVNTGMALPAGGGRFAGINFFVAQRPAG